MDIVALLVGLGPLIGWGLFPTIASKFGGRPSNQILGTTIGTFILALIFMWVRGLAFPSGSDLLLSIVSGIGWACAQIVTFLSFRLVGSSRAMPITTAFQLLGASLWGVFYLGDWPGVTAKIWGGIALIAIIIGAYFTVWSENKTQENSSLLKKRCHLVTLRRNWLLALFSGSSSNFDQRDGSFFTTSDRHVNRRDVLCCYRNSGK
ncbi:putative ribose uptake protein [Tetragenococcus muriaticus PMC-11-5]|uniref:Putative ribose uptake protein n=1 Tax=Tetragenococcus muriaticus PMC-11-5 TaxID=1302649 RepID=A0A091C8G8_9ENTE|nr:putative ribose uptake protein [Tetragenococcus muriaticus PMC-11-5]